MIVVDYNSKIHQEIVKSCVQVFKQGKVVVFPTDTSYGLAVDATNEKAVERLYGVKGRDFNKPVSVVAPSKEYAEKMVAWSDYSEKLAKRFWPGALTLILPLQADAGVSRKVTAGLDSIGLRLPDNKIALDLVKTLNKPITATSANPSGGYDCYSVKDVLNQFENKENKPDIIINTGRLDRTKPSTLVKVENDRFEVLRQGPVSEKDIKKALGV